MKGLNVNRKGVILIFLPFLIIFGKQDLSNAQVENPTITVSSASPLTDMTLDGGIVTLTLSGGVFVFSPLDIKDAIMISGMRGITFELGDIDRLSNSEIAIKLTFEGLVYTEAVSFTTLTFNVGAVAIKDYEGPTVTAQISMTNTVYIEGPWLWMIIPTHPEEGGGVSAEIDSLAKVSGNAVTETDVAQNGVTQGDILGQRKWTAGDITRTKKTCQRFCARGLFGGCKTLCWENNINTTVNTLGLGTGSENIKAYTAYALITLISPEPPRGCTDVYKQW